MIAAHEAEVAFRFDSLHRRFKPSIARDDYRLRGIVDALEPLLGKRILDLGCGKGRFARALQALRSPGGGARPVGGDAGRGNGGGASAGDGPQASLRPADIRRDHRDRGF